MSHFSMKAQPDGRIKITCDYADYLRIVIGLRSLKDLHQQYGIRLRWTQTGAKRCIGWLAPGSARALAGFAEGSTPLPTGFHATLHGILYSESYPKPTRGGEQAKGDKTRSGQSDPAKKS